MQAAVPILKDRLLIVRVIKIFAYKAPRSPALSLQREGSYTISGSLCQADLIDPTDSLPPIPPLFRQNRIQTG
jgi:hypothetical protein